MIRNIIIVVLLVGVGYFGFQTYTLQGQNHDLTEKLDATRTKIAKLTHHAAAGSGSQDEDAPKDYLALASMHSQRAEDALKAHNPQLAAKEFGFAKLALTKAGTQGLSAQHQNLEDVSARVKRLADQIKQLGDVIRG